MKKTFSIRTFCSGLWFLYFYVYVFLFLKLTIWLSMDLTTFVWCLSHCISEKWLYVYLFRLLSWLFLECTWSACSFSFHDLSTLSSVVQLVFDFHGFFSPFFGLFLFPLPSWWQWILHTFRLKFMQELQIEIKNVTCQPFDY